MIQPILEQNASRTCKLRLRFVEADASRLRTRLRMLERDAGALRARLRMLETDMSNLRTWVAESRQLALSEQFMLGRLARHTRRLSQHSILR